MIAQPPDWEMAAPWILVVAGVTPLGRRQAARAVATAISDGVDVLVLDGHVPPLTHADLDSAPDGQSSLRIYSFGEDERSGIAYRLIAPGTSSRQRAAWRVTSRRLGTLLRPWRYWSIARRAIEPLADGPPPQEIVCCDEVSITTTWKAARIWPDSLVRGG